MSKKEVLAEQTAVENTALSENAKNAKEKPKKDKVKKDKKKKDNKIIKSTRETASELKKVTWPSFKNVVKDTGIVLAFVLIFAIDTFLSWIVGLIA